MRDYLSGAAIAALATLLVGGALLAVTRLGGDPQPPPQPAAPESPGPPAGGGPLVSSDECAELVSRGEEGDCESEGVEHSVVRGDSPVRLDDVAVSLQSMRKTRVVRDPVLEERATAEDIFLLTRLKVTNRGSEPKTFNEQEDQVVLLIGENQYSTVDYEVQGPVKPLLIQQTIQPGGSKTGYVVFDVPRRGVRQLEKRGGSLAVFSFADAEAGLSAETPRGDILIGG